MDGGGPLGVFDSGLGGMTVVGEILRQCPGERIVYIGDSAHVPYGPRPAEQIRDFSLALGRCLVERFNCRAIVVACNTATGPGAPALRDVLSVPVIAMEPGLKPAVAQTKTGVVGVLATISTLSGDRYAKLVERFSGDVKVLSQPCPGLVECVERGDLGGPETRALVARYVQPLIDAGVDTLVLGCTHYPLLRPLIAEAARPGVTIIDTGAAVARQVMRVASCPLASGETASLLVLSTGGGTDADTYAVHARHFLQAMGIPSNAVEVRAAGLFWDHGDLRSYGSHSQ